MNDGISTLANDTSTVVNEHLSEWTASDWIGEIAVLAVGGVVGAVAIFAFRLMLWERSDGEAAPRPWFAGAITMWLLSTWLLIDTIGDLARHSPSRIFAAWFTFVAPILIIALFVFASRRVDHLRDQVGYAPSRFMLVWAVPSVVVFLIGVVTHFNEITHRGEWKSPLLQMIWLGGLFILAVAALLKVREVRASR